jgi:proteasome lid subunit RPN8/RPN11
MGETLRISRSLLARLVAEAAAAHEEICGLLLADGTPVACRNVHPEPSRHFEIDPAALIAAHRAGRGGGAAIIGHYHSHPSGDPTPSVTDAQDAAADGAIWLILGGGTARAWRAVRDGAVHGRFDPVTILAE